MERKSFDANFKGMLDGVRVVDLSRVVAGNMLTLQLADHGADVINLSFVQNKICDYESLKVKKIIFS